MPARIFLSLLAVALLASCSTSGKVKNGTNADHLTFGTGGGFTGIYTSYELDEDGRVFELQPDSILKPLKKLRKKKTRNIFEQATKLKLSQSAYIHPGNITNFITYKADSVLTTYKWGDPNISVPIEIKDLYNQLNSIVK
jgi:hypothetical protein